MRTRKRSKSIHTLTFQADEDEEKSDTYVDLKDPVPLASDEAALEENAWSSDLIVDLSVFTDCEGAVMPENTKRGTPDAGK